MTTFTELQTPRDIVTNNNQVVTSPLWANNVGTLTTYYTSSLMTSTQKQ